MESVIASVAALAGVVVVAAVAAGVVVGVVLRRVSEWRKGRDRVRTRAR